MLEKPDCDLCRKIKTSKGKEPNCAICLPKLMPENQIPFRIFWRIKNQHIMGEVTPVDLNMAIARNEIARYIKNDADQDYCFDLIYAAYVAYVLNIRERAKK